MSRAVPRPDLAFSTSITSAALLAIGAVAWIFLVFSERAMTSMAGAGPGPLNELMRIMMQPANAAPYLLAAFSMWLVMMIAMMMPAVMPMTKAYHRLDRGHGGQASPAWFVLGYFAGWTAFAVVAAVLQWWLHKGGWLRGHALASGPLLGGFVVAAAGIYQLTPVKEACLARCRSPLRFFLDHWEAGRRGALRMGLRHGLFCIGCCWVLMLIMYAGGAMSVLVMAALSIFILAERLLPDGPWVSRIPGAALFCGGVFLVLASTF